MRGAIPWLDPAERKLGPCPKASVAVWLVTVFDILGPDLEGSAFPVVDMFGLLGTVWLGPRRPKMDQSS